MIIELEKKLDVGYVSALFGIAGATVGGLTSLCTSWLTQHIQLRAVRRGAASAYRLELFREFISEASRLYGDALGHQKDDVSDLVRLYALVARMRLVASTEVLTAADDAMDMIIEAYLGPNMSLHEVRAFTRSGGTKFLLSFSECCRAELVDVERR
jgi:hypothetical protein